MITTKSTASIISRKAFYAAMIILLAAIFLGAYRQVPPVFLAVAFIAEVVLVCTVYLGTMIQQHGVPPSP